MKNKILKSKEEIKKELEEDYTIKKYKKKTYHDKYDILQQSKEFETIKKCNEIYKQLLDKRVYASNLIDSKEVIGENNSDEDEELKFLEIVKKGGENFNNKFRSYCASEKIKNSGNIKKKIELLDNIMNNKRLLYLKKKSDLNKNKNEKKEYVKCLRDLRNKLYRFNNSCIKEIRQKQYSFNGII